MSNTNSGVSFKAGQHHANWLDVKTILPSWIDHLVESFSYVKFEIK